MEWPDWVSREVLSGGFLGEPPAGGEPPEWERGLYERFGVSCREALNLYFLSAPGRRELLGSYEAGLVRVDVAEEGALLAVALNDGPGEMLRAFFDRLRFFPRLVEVPWSRPAWRTVHRHNVGEVIQVLRRYRLPVEIQRKRESLSRWRPLYEQMLEALVETREAGWPFQAYPPGWTERHGRLPAELDEVLEGDVACHFPQQSGSNFRRLLESLKRAVEDPEALDGREVGFARAVLRGSEEKWGPVGSPERAKRLAADLPGFPRERFVEALVERLAALDQEGGIPDPDELLEPIDGVPVPDVLCERVRRGGQAPMEEQIRAGLVPSVEVFSELVPQLVGQLLEGGLEFQTYLALRRHRRSLVSLPWIDLSCEPAEAQDLGRYLLELFWRYFPWEPMPVSLRKEMEFLAGHDLVTPEDLETAFLPSLDWERAAKACRDWCSRESGRRYERAFLRRQRDQRVGFAGEMENFFRGRWAERAGDPPSPPRNAPTCSIPVPGSFPE